MPHLTVAVSEASAAALFSTLRDKLNAGTTLSGNLGWFTASLNLGYRLENGHMEFQSDGTVLISELDVVYDPVQLTLGVDIPTITIGGFCLLWLPFAGCVVTAPTYTLFQGNPDLSISTNLSGLVQSEVSGAFSIDTQHFLDPARPTGATDLEAEDAGHPNKWRIFLNPSWVDLDVIDIADTAGNILNAAINAAVGSLIGWLPGWAQNLINALVGGLVNLVRTILDIGDDIDEWLSNLFNVSLGLFDFILQMILDFFASEEPLFEFENPFPILPPTSTLIPVKIPLNNVSVVVNDAEMVIGADVGP